MFKLHSHFQPAGDQPQAIEKLIAGLNKGLREQTLLGVTGSGKTFTMANVIAQKQKPTLVISHNKTLAAQLYEEFKTFFPENAVHYFVSYYDYYQPEAYIPHSDTYIEKEATINEEIDRLRHAATQALLNRKDIIIVASVSCIYGVGSRQDYEEMSEFVYVGQSIKRNELLRRLIAIQYERNDIAFTRGQIRAQGNILEIFLATGEAIVRFIFAGDVIEKIDYIPLINKIKPIKTKTSSLETLPTQTRQGIKIIPAKHFMTPKERLKDAIELIEDELMHRLEDLRIQGKVAEAERLQRKTNYDIEMLKETGYCNGVENYSRHLAGRAEDSPPETLLDFFDKDYLMFIDESHVSLPQIRGMYFGDKSRKETLVEFGFRLPSARDNRPLKFDEFNSRINQVIYVSATPSVYELENSKQIVEQIVRPTGLLDPLIEVRQKKDQIKNLIQEVEKAIEKGERVLITTLTKRMSEELSDYLIEEGIKAIYLHSEIKTLERSEILRDFKKGRFDCLVGVNLLREGLDLPQVALIVIMDADMSGFLRNETSLIQTMGRAARNLNGRVIMYADEYSLAMKSAIKETTRRRKLQEEYNLKHSLTPKGIF